MESLPKNMIIILAFNIIFLYLFSIPSSSLKIYENSYSNDYKLFYHRTAEFGPQPGDYNVSSPLQIIHPTHACDISRYKLDTQSNDDEYDQIYDGMIVLILRGECTFSDKIYFAQLLGAKGAIVGDYNVSEQSSNKNKNNDNDNQWIVMSKQPNDGRHIVIPSIFIEYNTYSWIKSLVLSHEAHYQTLYDNSSDSSYNDSVPTTVSPVPPLEDSGVFAMMDSDGEYVEPTNTLWLAAFGIVIVVIPSLWCIIVCITLLRKKIMRCAGKRRRKRLLDQIPIIKFEGCANKSKNEKELTSDNEQQSPNSNSEKNGEKYSKLLTIQQNDDASGNFEGAGGGGNTTKFDYKKVGELLFKTFHRKSQEIARPHNDSCCICLDDFQLNEHLRLLPCCHGFHVHCIDPWLSKSSELCPMCKQSINDNANDSNNSDKCGDCSVWRCCSSNNNSQNASASASNREIRVRDLMSVQRELVDVQIENFIIAEDDDDEFDDVEISSIDDVELVDNGNN